jgi:hypothetical protein
VASGDAYRLAEVNGSIAALKSRMREYWALRDMKRDRIMRTFPCGQIEINGYPKLVVLKWTPDGAEARHAMFPDLDAFNKKWGPVADEMRILKAEAKALEQAIKAADKQAQREAKGRLL